MFELVIYNSRNLIKVLDSQEQHLTAFTSTIVEI